MRKVIYIFLIVFILIFIIWSLNLFGILQLDDFITEIPYVKERLKTDEQYDRLMNEYYSLEKGYDKLKTENEILNKDINELENKLIKKEEILADIEVKYEKLRNNVKKTEDRINKLVKIYGNMDPEEAAKLMADLNTDTSIKIIDKLKDDHIAEIMINLPTEKALEITERLKK